MERRLPPLECLGCKFRKRGSETKIERKRERERERVRERESEIEREGERERESESEIEREGERQCHVVLVRTKWRACRARL